MWLTSGLLALKLGRVRFFVKAQPTRQTLCPGHPPEAPPEPKGSAEPPVKSTAQTLGMTSSPALGLIFLLLEGKGMS